MFKLPTCENPVITRPEYGAWKIFPCGKCARCRYRKTREWSGKGIAELRFPEYPEHAAYGMCHFFTLTYNDDHVPRTEPGPNQLGYVRGPQGASKPFSGPFPRPVTINWRRPEKGFVELRSGIPCWKETGDRLDDIQLAEAHRQFLISCGWHDEKIRRWEKGDYPSELTTCYADGQKFMKRLRNEIRRADPNLPPLRYILATEYGGETGRPHMHLMVWGIPQELATWVHELWFVRSQMGYVSPNEMETEFGGRSIAGPYAAHYQAKDVSKNRRDILSESGSYQRETPVVRGSKCPAIGHNAYGDWVDTQILPKLKKAAGDQEAEVRILLDEYTRIHLRTGRNMETFPTPRPWRERLLSELQLPEYLVEDLRADEIATVSKFLVSMDKEPRFRELYDEHLRNIVEGSREAEQREAERRARKRAAFGAPA